MKYLFFYAQQGGIQNSHQNGQFIRHGNSFMEKWMSKFVFEAENTGSVNTAPWNSVAEEKAEEKRSQECVS